MDDGTLVAEGVDGAFLFRRSDVERLKAHRPSRRPPTPTMAPVAVEPVEPVVEVPVDEVLEQALLLGRFVIAFERGEPGPCPVCGKWMTPSSWPVHLLRHRQQQGTGRTG